ncbi:unnamed protein product [Cyprideis torosa]|uniref:Cilia- and flagella-associated protein 45 n=1 Tax=Cyprideis torosa TaxID=163714 RepID=A0A7R8W0U0_9CRUS|nr:unnamed protein product [Cyprideis torosa]CAG0880152.1 unnamed protein product [Cyprideis torosa]
MPRSPTGRPFSVSGGGGRGDIPHIRLPSSMRPSTTQSVISKLNVKKMDMVEGGGMGMCGLECNNHCGLICIVFSVIFVISGVLLTIVGFRYRDRDKDTSSDSYFFGNKKTLQIGGPVLMFAGFLMLFLGVVFCFLKYKVKQNAREEAEYMKEYHCSGNHDTEHHMDLSSSYRKGSAMSSVNQIRATSSVRPWQNGDSLTLGNYAKKIATEKKTAFSVISESIRVERRSGGVGMLPVNSCDERVPVIEANSVRFLKVRRRTGDHLGVVDQRQLDQLKELVSAVSPSQRKPETGKPLLKAPPLEKDAGEEVELRERPLNVYRKEEIAKEAKEVADHALELIVARETAVKRAEQLSLAVKCQALRDVQIKARQDALKRERIEDLIMDEIMEQNQRELYEEEQRKQKERKRSWQSQAEDLDRQTALRNKEQAREISRIEREWQIEQLQAQKVAEEMAREKEQRSQKKRRTAQDLLQSNQRMLEEKERQKQREREEDKKSAQFMQEKARQEEEREKRKAMSRQEKQKILKELEEFADQQKVRGKGYDLALLRAEEQRDREWRQREREAIERKQKLRKDRLAEQSKIPARQQEKLMTLIQQERQATEELISKMVKAKEMDEEEEMERIQKIRGCKESLYQQMKDREEVELSHLAKEARDAAILAQARKDHDERIRANVEEQIRELEGKQISKEMIENRPCTQSTLAESFRKASVLEENGSSGTLITEGVLKDNLPALDTATEVGSTGCGAPAANGGVRLSVGLPPPQLLPHTPTPMTPPASDSVCHTCARPSTATNMLGYRQSFGDLTSTRISDVACFPPEPEEESSPVVSSSPRLSKTSLSTGTLSSNPCSRPASAPQEQRNVTANVIPPTPPYNDVTVPVDT